MVKMIHEPQKIGRHTYVDLVSQQVTGVPAKVDTGADSSSIWASEIVEQDGELSFVLFDHGSPYYTGKKITTREFEQVSVRNSFGDAEYRYKAKLLTIIEKRKIRVAFTLADRSKTRYPILIGRNTLRGKFYVDVARKVNHVENRRVLFLSTRRSENVINMISAMERAAAGKLTIDYAVYDDLVLAFNDGVMSVAIGNTGRDLADYAMVHFKTSLARDLTAALARYAKSRGVQLVDEAVSYFPDMSKLYQYSVLESEKLRVPDSLLVVPSQLEASYKQFSETLGVPFVLKGIHASRGDVNVVIRGEEEFRKQARDAHEQNIYLVGQRFVQNTGDYRILVFGKHIALVIHRVRKDDSTHLNNTSAGGSATLVDVNDLPPQVRIDSIRAADVLSRGIAGVDAIYDTENDEWLFLEVNDGPQLATGAFLAEKHKVLAEYFVKELEK